MKENHEYNTDDMTFVLKAVRHTLTGDYTALNDAEKLAALIGAMNMAQDSMASLTIKSGFTAEQRRTKAAETIAAINAGDYKKVRAAGGGGLSTAKVINILDIAKKFVRAKLGDLDWSEITLAEAEAIKKYDIDSYNDYLAMIDAE